MELIKMKTKCTSGLMLIVVAGVLLTLTVTTQWGCSDRVKGTAYSNQKPIAYFVNVPPNGSQTSRNTLINWAGTDADGQVKQFRYIVVLRDSMKIDDSTYYSPAEYANGELQGFPASRWIYLQVAVDPIPDPQTSAIVRMSADLTNPVSKYVQQYIFLQAIDDRGLSSDVVWKLISRNDHPPETDVKPQREYSEGDNPFINARDSGGLITGMRLSWSGADELDYPVDPPPFQFQWKLFGPYGGNDTSGEWKLLLDSHTVRVFVTNDAKVYPQGLDSVLLYYCDSVDTAADTIVSYLCETIIVDTISKNNNFGRLERMFLADDPAFLADTLYRFVDSSESADQTGWISETGDTLFNLFRSKEQDSTNQQRFLFWARCRDDANVADLVPWYGPFGVIEPMFERDVAVIDFTKLHPSHRHNAPQRVGTTITDSGYTYWKRALDNWAIGSLNRDSLVFDTSNYINLNGRGDDIGLTTLLKYKVLIAYNEDANNASWYTAAAASRGAVKVYKAIDAGVNVWYMMRAPFVGNLDFQPTSFNPIRDRGDFLFVRYFPLEEVRYTGWSYMAGPSRGTARPDIRIEDFKGALVINDETYPHPGWPDVRVDTVNLHHRLKWGTTKLRYHDDLPDSGLIPDKADLPYCLPEVGWVVRRLGTDPLYLYESSYGDGHFLGSTFTYAGHPVAFRYGTSLFRTAFFCFTPLTMEDSTMQIVIDSVMNYLYDRYLTTPAPLNRYSDAVHKITASDIISNERERAAMLERFYREERK